MIGIDKDNKNRFRMLMAYFNGSRIATTKVFNTRHGYHLKIDTTVEPEKNLEIRRTLGDDPQRIEVDEWKLDQWLLSWMDTLFERKQYPDGTISREEPMNPLAEQFWGVRI